MAIDLRDKTIPNPCHVANDRGTFIGRMQLGRPGLLIDRPYEKEPIVDFTQSRQVLRIGTERKASYTKRMFGKDR